MLRGEAQQLSRFSRQPFRNWQIFKKTQPGFWDSRYSRRKDQETINDNQQSRLNVTAPYPSWRNGSENL